MKLEGSILKQVANILPPFTANSFLSRLNVEPLYSFLKLWVRSASLLYIKRFRLMHAAKGNAEGPVLIAANHPNAFMDAILVAAHLHRPVWFMARGDVFKKKWANAVLRRLNMIPVYRMRDGKDKLSLNESSFQEAEMVLKAGDQLLIFVEGICLHQTSLLLPLKKGAPRLLMDCWLQQVPVKVLPVWVQYSSFDKIGKTIAIRFGETFGQEILPDEMPYAAACNLVNDHTARALLQLHDAEVFEHKVPAGFYRALLWLPAMLGALLHAPLYWPVAKLAARLNGKAVQYDGLVFAMLMVLYPLYLFLAGCLVFQASHSYTLAFAAAAAMILLARIFIAWKK